MEDAQEQSVSTPAATAVAENTATVVEATEAPSATTTEIEAGESSSVEANKAEETSETPAAEATTATPAEEESQQETVEPVAQETPQEVAEPVVEETRQETAETVAASTEVVAAAGDSKENVSSSVDNLLAEVAAEVEEKKETTQVEQVSAAPKAEVPAAAAPLLEKPQPAPVQAPVVEPLKAAGESARTMTSPSSSGGPRGKGADGNDGRTLIFKNLSHTATEASLQSLLERFGVVEHIELLWDNGRQRPRDFGFITMKTSEDAQAVLNNISGTLINDRKVIVEVAKRSSAPRSGGPRPERGRGPPARGRGGRSQSSRSRPGDSHQSPLFGEESRRRGRRSVSRERQRGPPRGGDSYGRDDIAPGRYSDFPPSRPLEAPGRYRDLDRPRYEDPPLRSEPSRYDRDIRAPPRAGEGQGRYSDYPPPAVRRERDYSPPSRRIDDAPPRDSWQSRPERRDVGGGDMLRDLDRGYSAPSGRPSEQAPPLRGDPRDYPSAGRRYGSDPPRESQGSLDFLDDVTSIFNQPSSTMSVDRGAPSRPSESMRDRVHAERDDYLRRERQVDLDGRMPSSHGGGLGPRDARPGYSRDPLPSDLSYDRARPSYDDPPRMREGGRGDSYRASDAYDSLPPRGSGAEDPLKGGYRRSSPVYSKGYDPAMSGLASASSRGSAAPLSDRYGDWSAPPRRDEPPSTASRYGGSVSGTSAYGGLPDRGDPLRDPPLRDVPDRRPEPSRYDRNDPRGGYGSRAPLF
mmetsp:Transcript_6518/g.16164  ORF Transcript_6518/g.16164 Transcript_6518/m.16164 type:complete len:748 (-) Transcript_6518:1503-3746(-)